MFELNLILKYLISTDCMLINVTEIFKMNSSTILNDQKLGF